MGGGYPLTRGHQRPTPASRGSGLRQCARSGCSCRREGKAHAPRLLCLFSLASASRPRFSRRIRPCFPKAPTVVGCVARQVTSTVGNNRHCCCALPLANCLIVLAFILDSWPTAASSSKFWFCISSSSWLKSELHLPPTSSLPPWGTGRERGGERGREEGRR